MSSREIAELTGKLHKDVLRDTRKMLDDLEINGRNFRRSTPTPMEEVSNKGFGPKTVTEYRISM